MTPYRDITHDGFQFHVYDCFSDFVNYLTPQLMDSLVAKGHHSSSGISHKAQDSSRWSGGNNFRKAHELASTGQPFAPEAIEIRDQLNTAVETIREQAFAWDVTGDAVDVGAFMSGEPECMLTTMEQDVQAKKVINIVYYFDASCGVPAEHLEMQGIAMMALIDSIMSTGHYVVNLWFANAVCPSGSSGSHGGCIMIKLMDQARQYDPQSVSYAIANVGMLRQMCFNYYLHLDSEAGRRWYGNSYKGLGRPAEANSFPPELELDMEATVTGEAWHLGEKDTNQIRNKASALQWVQKRMEMISTQQ